jgi:uncharacterized protein YprB with RNaseH-like and TPR domain
MLKRTFIHLPQIGPTTELRLWRQGLAIWEDLLGARHVPGFSPGRLALIHRHLEESQANLDRPAYFSRRLPAAERWRLFGQYQDRTAYLDIETTGASWPHLTVTVIGLYDGRDFYQFVLGQNLHDFLELVDAQQVLVTFNGSQFDLPVLQAFFGRPFPHAHIDLRPVLARLGYKGGLKKIEPRFGLQRPTDVEGLNGYDAVLLWQRAQRGDTAAGEKLMAYNRADVINLETLMVQAYELACRHTLAPLTQTLSL